jgi:glycosyltransferase involved in cell wall biosynthesis
MSESIKKIEGGKRLFCSESKLINASPLVSYVTISLNSEKTISRTIESVSNQTYNNCEYVIVDGGSRDDTVEVISKFALNIDYFISERDDGIYNAFNKALSFVRGDIVCFINADDWLCPDAAQTAVDLLRNCDNLSVLVSSAIVYDSLRGSWVWRPRPINAGSYFTGANVCHNAIYARRRVYEVVGVYNESYKIAGDFEWLMRCFESNVNFMYTESPTANFSSGGVSSNIASHCMESMRVLSDRYSFLNEDEVKDLILCFYDLYKEAGLASKLSYMGSRTDFLKHILGKYSDNENFARSVAFASMEKLIHPMDSRIFALVEDVKYSMKNRLLSSSPVLFRLLKRIIYR